MSRRLPNFIKAFSQYSHTFNTVPAFSEWGGIWQIGTAVTRSVGMRIRGNSLHPNIFALLVAGPGTGKSQLVKAVRSILVPATKMSLIPPSITRAGLEDYMQKNLKMDRKDPSGKQLVSNECIGLAEEMQGILPDQDMGHLTLYNLLYDLPDMHMAQTRTNGEVRLDAPYASLLVGAQPAFLATAMPEQAWGMGFMSRTIMVFDVARDRRSAFELQDVDRKLQADLIHDLQQIYKLNGWITWSPDARALYEEWWVKEGGTPVPQAKRLAMGYNSRRELHFFKLAMIQSLAESNDLIVTLDHAAAAIELLIRTEEKMKSIFNEMAQTGAMVAIEDMLDAVRTRTASGKDMPEADLIQMLLQRFPSTQVHSLVENLIASKAILVSGGLEARGMRRFKAAPKIGLGV